MLTNRGLNGESIRPGGQTESRSLPGNGFAAIPKPPSNVVGFQVIHSILPGFNSLVARISGFDPIVQDVQKLKGAV